MKLSRMDYWIAISVIIIIFVLGRSSAKYPMFVTAMPTLTVEPTQSADFSNEAKTFVIHEVKDFNEKTR